MKSLCGLTRPPRGGHTRSVISGRDGLLLSRERQRRTLGVALLAVCLVLAHLPLPVASAQAPGALVDVAACAQADAPPSAGDGCCAPIAPQAVVAVPDACCGPSASEGATPGEGGEPCCPNGCTHCAQSCCSAPLALSVREGDLTVEVLAAQRVELPLPRCTSATPEGIFHPPRG